MPLFAAILVFLYRKTNIYTHLTIIRTLHSKAFVTFTIMSDLDFLEIPTDTLMPNKQKDREIIAEGAEKKRPTNVMTNAMGTEMVVNNQIKVKMKELKQPGDDKKAEANDTLAIIEKIKAKLRKEFDLTTPVERNDDDYKKKSKKQTAEPGGMESFSGPIKIPNDEILFEKQYYTMGQVSEMFHVNPSMLRFWENEFDILKPKKNKKGDRHFRPVDIKNLELIYHLLRQRKFTIDGAKTFLKQNKQKSMDSFAAVQSLQNLKSGQVLARSRTSRKLLTS